MQYSLQQKLHICMAFHYYMRKLWLFLIHWEKNSIAGGIICIPARTFQGRIPEQEQAAYSWGCTKSGSGLPKYVLQDKVLNMNQQAQVCGTVKAIDLLNNNEIPGLVAVSAYNTKPVHFLTTRCKNVCQESKFCRVYDKKKKNSPTEFFTPECN